MSSQSQSRSIPADLSAPPMVDRWRRNALPVAGVFIAGSIIAAVVDFSPFLRAYLTGYMLFLGISLGSMALLMVQHLAGGKWGIPTRRVLEASARNVPMMVLLFLPIALGAKSIYAWMGPHNAMVEGAMHAANWKQFWLNYPFWLVRAAICFAIWWFYSSRLTTLSIGRDNDSPQNLLKWQVRLENLSGFGIVVYSLTLTCAAVDWVMSLDVTWFSTMYGLIFLVGEGLSALALGIIAMTLLSRDEPLASIVKVREMHDNGKLLFAFVMLFAYVSFSQFLIIWCGNLPEEISWYNQRVHGGWGYVGFAVLAFHFCLPWLVLLSRDIKRHGRALRRLAYFMILMRGVDLYWQVEPNFSRNSAGKWVSVNFIEKTQFAPHWHFEWQFLVVPVAIGACWLIGLCMQLKKYPMIPVNDPQLYEILKPEHAHA